MKRFVVLLLIACTLCSLLVMAASARGVEPVVRIETVYVDETDVRQYGYSTAPLLGHLYKGDIWYADNDESNGWWSGSAGHATQFYKKYGSLRGYVLRSAF